MDSSILNARLAFNMALRLCQIQYGTSLTFTKLCVQLVKVKMSGNDVSMTGVSDDEGETNITPSNGL